MSIRFLSALAGACMLAGTANATTVNVTYQASNSAYGTQGWGQGLTVTSSVHNSGNPSQISAGMFQLHGDNGLGDFSAFCVDLTDWLQNNKTYTVAPSLYTGAVLANIDRLFTSAYASISSSVEAAGFQVALWEIIYDHGNAHDLDSGDFKMSANAAVEAQANSYLAGLAGASTGGYKLTFLYSGDYQDVVTATPVPLPASGLLLIAGLGGVAAARRRSKK